MVNKHLLWALLALSPLALAEPAAPAAPTETAKPPSATTLATDYLMRELSARTTVKHGKSIQPDKASKNVYPPQQMAAVRSVFGSEAPLLVQRKPGAGRIDYSIVLPAREYKDDRGSFAWEQASMQVGVARNGTQTMVGRLPSLSIADKLGRFDFTGISTSSTTRSDYWSGKSRGEIKKISFAASGESGNAFTIEEMRFGSDVKRQGQYMNALVEFNLGRIGVQEHGVDNLHMAMRWRKIDAGVLAAAKQEMDRMNAAGQTEGKELEELARFVPMLKRLVLRGAALDIDDLSASFNGHKIAISGSLSMPNAADQDFESGPAVINKLAGRLDIAVPLPLLREIANQMAAHANAGKEKTNAPTGQLAAQMYEMMLGKALANQYARLDKETLRSTIELKGGVLAVNGNAMPLEALLALFEDKKVPPADTEAPVAITMRGRGLVAAQLFAMNGDARGVWEMCQRASYGIDTEKDPEQASKWCNKAWNDQEYRAAVPLGELYLDGLLDDAAVPPMVQEAADRHADEEARYLMYRMHSEGKGAAKDAHKAAAYLKQSAEQGYGKAVQAMQEMDAGYKAPAGATSDPVAKDPWNFPVDVAAGFYSERSFRFDTAKHRSLSVSMESMKRHEKWAPLLAVCVSAINPSDVACFNLTGLKGEEPQIEAVSNLRGTASRERRNANALEGTFKPGARFDLTVYASGKKVHFLVNGRESLDQEVNFPVEVLTLSCSTANCNFKFRQAN